MKTITTADGEQLDVIVDDEADIRPKPGYRPTAETLAILKSPSIFKQFPLSFENGTIAKCPPTFVCPRCRRKLFDVHARISRVIEPVADVKSVGICRDCELIIPYAFRIRDTGEIESYFHGRWTRAPLYPPDQSLWGRVKTAWNGRGGDDEE